MTTPPISPNPLPLHSSSQQHVSHHALLNRPGMEEVLTALNVKQKDIQQITVQEGVGILSVDKKILKRIKDSLDSIETLNKDELNRLVSLLGLNPDDVAYYESQGGSYLIQESLSRLQDD